jgi:hypothetical protein
VDDRLTSQRSGPVGGTHREASGYWERTSSKEVWNMGRNVTLSLGALILILIVVALVF